MARGEVVRLAYGTDTRMVSVVWRGRSIDLVALPAAHDIAATRFGVAVGDGRSVRITGASAGGVNRACVRRCAHRVVVTPFWRGCVIC